MKRFSKKHQEEAICPSCGLYKPTDFTPEQLKDRDWECLNCATKRSEGQNPERGSQPISKYDKEYEDLLKLTNLLVKEGVPPQEIKDLTLANPFHTITETQNLFNKILNLAVEKYNIPLEWLNKKLPKKADLWPAQEASECTLSHVHNSLSYNNEQEKDTSVSGPRPDDVEKEASPETDHALYLSAGQDVVNEYFFDKGIRWSQVVSFLKELVPQLTFQDIEQLKTDTKYRLEQFKIQINSAKKKIPLNINKVIQILNQKEPKVIRIDLINHTIELADGAKLTFDEATNKAMEIDKEGVFSGAEFSTTEFNTNPTLDNGPFSSPTDYGATEQEQVFPNTNWLPADDENKDEEPYSNIASNLKKPFSKKADFSGQAVNTILKGLESSGKVVYNLTKGHMEMPDENYTSMYTEREQVIEGPVDFDIIEGYIENNKDLLQDVNNSLYAHMDGDKVVLDIVTEKLPARTFSKKELNIVKRADESPLSQDEQDQIAAKWCPAMNILLNNYNDSVKRGHSKDRSLEYALYSIQNIDTSITEKQAVEAINTYL